MTAPELLASPLLRNLIILHLGLISSSFYVRAKEVPDEFLFEIRQHLRQFFLELLLVLRVAVDVLNHLV